MTLLHFIFPQRLTTSCYSADILPKIIDVFL
jgi:hypothetical protein